MKHFLTGLIAVILAFLASTVAHEFYYGPQSKNYTDLAVAEAAAVMVAPDSYESCAELFRDLENTHQELIIDSILTELPGATLINIFTVSAKKYGLPLTKSEIVAEYTQNQAIYDNLPNTKEDVSLDSQPAGEEQTPILPDTLPTKQVNNEQQE